MSRDFEREIIPMARAFGMALAPWDVLGSGRFHTKKQIEERRARSEGFRANIDPSEDEAKMGEALYKVAQEHGTESVMAVALAYVISKAPDVFPIIGGRKVEHLKDNIQALSIKLTDEQIQYLEAVKPFDPGFPNNMLSDPNVEGSSKLLDRTAKMSFPSARK